MQNITMIAAIGENNALGKDNDLLWHLPDDFKHFKRLTTGHKIIMGRKTFESFPKPLPNRIHIIITRDKSYKISHADCVVVHSLDEAIKLVEKDAISFIIGGGEIYRQAEKFANRLEITRVHESFDADTFFPEINDAIWKLETSIFHPKDEKHLYDFTYLTYMRIQS